MDPLNIEENWKTQSNDNYALNMRLIEHTIIMFWRRGWISKNEIDKYTSEAKTNIDIVSGNKDVSTTVQFSSSTKSPYNTAIIKINYENKSASNVKFNSKYLNNDTYKLIIMMENLDEGVAKNNHTQIIPYKHMCHRDPLAHVSQPIPESWRILSDEETREIDEDYENNKLPIMYITDRIAVYMYFSVGDVVEYETFSPVAGKSLFWVRVT